MDHGDHDRIGLERALNDARRRTTTHDDAMHGTCLRTSHEPRQETRYDVARFAYRYLAPRSANDIALRPLCPHTLPKMLPPDPMTPR